MLVFLVAGAGGAYKGASELYLEWQLQQHGQPVMAEVTRSIARRSGTRSNDRRSWRDVTYQFQVGADTYSRTVDIDLHYLPPQAGAVIPVRYLPDDPARNWPREYHRTGWAWFALGFGGLISVFSSAVVVGMLVVRCREGRAR